MRRADVILFSVGIMVTAPLGSVAMDALSLNSSTNQNLSVPPQGPRYVRLTPALAEILRMFRTRMDTDVIKTYIKSSKLLYNPSADEVVTLKRLGVPEDILTTVLEHDGQLRQARASLSARPTYPIPPEYGNQPAVMQNPLPARPNPSPGYAFYRPFLFPFGAPVVSFNNSYPTVVNGQPVYSGYYIPGYLW